MYSKKIAIIVAGGTGQRMGSVVPKQFLEIQGKAILLHTIDQFVAAFSDIELVVVLPHEEACSHRGNHIPTNRLRPWLKPDCSSNSRTRLCDCSAYRY